MRAQVSVEFVLTFGFALVIMVPIILFAYDSYKESEDSINVKQAEQAGLAIVREAESVFFLGPPSQSNVQIYFPENIFSVDISSFELTIRVRTTDGIDEVAIPSRVNLSGTLDTYPGQHYVQVTTDGNQAIISE